MTRSPSIETNLVRFWRARARGRRVALAVSAVAALSVGIGLYFLPSLGLRYLIQRELKVAGMAEVEIAEVEVSLFGGRVTLKRASATAPAGPQARLDDMAMLFSWGPLLSRRVSLGAVALSGLSLELARRADGRFIVSGLPLPTIAGDAGPEAGTSWLLGIDELTITDSTLVYAADGLRTTLAVKRLRLEELRGWRPEAATRLELDATINGAPLTVAGEIQPFAAAQEAKLAVKLDGLDLGRLPVLPRPIETRGLGGRLNLDLQITAAVAPSGGLRARAEGNAGLERGHAVGAFGTVAGAKLEWRGSAGIDPDAILVAGTIIGSGLALDAEDAKATLGTLKIELGSLRVDPAGTTTVTGAIAGTGLALTAGETKFSAADFRLDLKPLKAAFPPRRPGQLAWSGRLELADLSFAVPGLMATPASVVWDGEASAELDANAPPRGSIGGRLALGRTRATLVDPLLWIESEAARAEGTLVHGGEGTSAKLSLQTISAGLPASPAIELLSVARIDVDDIKRAADGSMTAASLKLSRLQALQRRREAGNPGYPWRVDLAGATLTGPTLKPGGDVAATSLEIERLLLRVTRTATGLVGLDALPPPSGSESKSAPAKETSIPGPALALGRLELRGDSRIIFEDRAPRDKVRFTVAPLALRLDNLDSAKPRQDSPLRFTAKIGSFTQIRLAGSARPFLARPGLDLKGRIDGFDLPALSPYAAETLGVRLHTGRLDADLVLALKDERLVGDTKLVVSNLTLDEVAKDKSALAAQSGMPVETVIGLLQDSDNVIRLAIPITGDYWSPEFNLNDAIGQAVGGALRDTATAVLGIAFPIIPLISLISDRSDRDRLGLTPLAFAPGEAALSDPQRVYLDQLAKLLKERPALKLNLCPTSTRADWAPLWTARPPEPLPTGVATTVRGALTWVRQSLGQVPAAAAATPPPPEPEEAALADLAAERSRQVKLHLAERGGIEEGRLFECRPAVDFDEKALPRVDLML